MTFPKSLSEICGETEKHGTRQHPCSSLHQVLGGGGGGRGGGLYNQARELWQWCLLHRTIATAEHVQKFKTGTPTKLHLCLGTATLRSITFICCKLSNRLVSFRLKKKSPIFCRWKSDQGAWEIDAFNFTKRPLCFHTILSGGKSYSK